MQPTHAYEVRPRRDKRGFDLILMERTPKQRTTEKKNSYGI